MVILDVILHLRHNNILNNQLYVKYVILKWFLFFCLLGYFWDNFQYFGKKSKYYGSDLKKIWNNLKPT